MIAMQKTWQSFSLRILLIAAVLAAWEALVRLFEIPSFILPPPSNVFMALYRGFASTMYFGHIGTTLLETMLGFAVGCTMAFTLGVAVALSRRTEYFLYPFIVMFQAMPKVALAPIIIIWFGLGITSKVVTAALVAFFPLLVNTIVGLRSSEEDRVNLMRSLAADPNQRYQSAEEMRVALEQWLLNSSRMVVPGDIARIVRERMNPERRKLVEAVMSSSRALPEAL